MAGKATKSKNTAKNVTKASSRQKKANKNTATTSSSTVSLSRSRTPKKSKPEHRSRKARTVMYAKVKRLPAKRATSEVRKAVTRKRSVSSSLSEIKNEPTLNKLFGKVISDLMVHRRSTLHYVRVSSSPDDGTDLTGSRVSLLSSSPSLGPFPPEDARSTQTTTESWIQNQSSSASSSSTGVSGKTSVSKSIGQSSKKKKGLAKVTKAAGNLSYFGPEHVRWLKENAPRQTKYLKLPALPEDVRPTVRPITGAFRSQLVKYRTAAEKKEGENKRNHCLELVEKSHGLCGNNDPGWYESEVALNISRSSSTPVKIGPAEPRIKPVVRKRSDSFVLRVPTVEAFNNNNMKGQLRQIGGGIPTNGAEEFTAKDFSSREINNNDINKFPSPLAHSTPLTSRKTSSNGSVVASSQAGMSKMEAQGEQSFVNSRTSSLYKEPVQSGKTPWLVEAAKTLEEAQGSGKPAVLSSNYLLKNKSAPKTNASFSSAAQNSETFVTAIGSEAPLSTKEFTESGKEVFKHKKNIHLRLMVDKNRPMEADCTVQFESTHKNPSIKITQLLVDDHPMWTMGSSSSASSMSNQSVMTSQKKSRSRSRSTSSGLRTTKKPIR